jgi:hypothetical protein
LTGAAHTIEIVSTETVPNALLTVAGLAGVFQMANPGSVDGAWSVLSTELPHGFVRDLHYNQTDDLLVAGLLGRGAWLLPDVSQGFGLRVVNNSVTFDPIAATFTTTLDVSGCPSGFSGKFGFDAQLTNISDGSLANLVIQVNTLTGDNLLQNADRGPGGVGSRLTVTKRDDFSDGVLGSAQFVDVPFSICLKEIAPFRFLVDVLGTDGTNVSGSVALR